VAPLFRSRVDMVLVAVALFLCAKVAQAVYLAMRRTGGLVVAVLIFVAGTALVYGRTSKMFTDQLSFLTDREEIDIVDERPAFVGPGAEKVFVNADGKWKRATRIGKNKTYRAVQSAVEPSRLSTSLLAGAEDENARARIAFLHGGVKSKDAVVEWDGMGWWDIQSEGAATGEIEIRVTPLSGNMWVSDPALTYGGDRPNVIVIFIDALRADHLSTYGYNRGTSPRIDELASGGVLYEQHYSPSAWTTSSVASAFTGRYSRQHGCVDFGSLTLPSELTTFAEVYKNAGYRTVGISANPLLSVKTGFAQGFDMFDEKCMEKHHYGSGQCVTDRALEVFDGQKPTMMFLHYMDPHLPYISPPPFPFKFRGSPSSTDRGAYIELMIDLYDGSISYSDAHIGRLMDGLENMGVAEDTVVIVTADHGEEMADHGAFNHGHTVFEEVVHVPLVIAGKNIPAGVRVNKLTSGVDLFATMMDIAGVVPEFYFAGESILPRGGLSREWIISDMHDKIAFRRGRYKLIVDTGLGKKTLYDLETDPSETNDIAKREPVVVSREFMKLQTILDNIDTVKPPSPRVRKLILEHRNRLRALGYVD